MKRTARLLFLAVFILAAFIGIRLWNARALAQTQIRWPNPAEATGSDGSLVLDTANLADGYFYAWVSSETDH